MSIKQKLTAALSVLDLVEDAVTIGTDSLRHHREELQSDRALTKYINELERADAKAEAKSKFMSKWDGKKKVPTDTAVNALIKKLI